MIDSRARRLVVLASTALLPLVLQPLSAEAAVIPSPMFIAVYKLPAGNGFEVCGYGESDSATNFWQLAVAGTVTGSDMLTGSGPVFNKCITTIKAALAGQLVGTFSFQGTGPDVVAAFPGIATWAPGQPDRALGSGGGN